ncbi:MAG: hypothetical protein CM15mP12_1290 [Gammaproteobacteria bacterium]|nr:MAG: hypothetical protein CM15mP12_1290 [Gammaproteobacteria bacterium]
MLILGAFELSSQSSETRSCLAKSPFTFFMSAPSKSILFIATIIGTSADFCVGYSFNIFGLTLSFAATTSITISVVFAPLALIAENASCPGVSMNVIIPVFFTSYAARCCVIPPDSPSTTFVDLIASSNEVFHDLHAHYRNNWMSLCLGLSSDNLCQDG